jgi:16S rRNA (guanine527-N7)-methyltransferase
VTSLARLESYAARLGLSLSAVALERLENYRDILLEANKRFNLTRITDPAEFEQRVLIESIALVTLIPEGASTLLDVGSGGGIPGLPVAIARPDLNVALLDSTAKKVNFLSTACEALGLDNVIALNGRAEEVARDPAHRDHYDVVTARAVARLVTLAELTLPLVAPGGIVILPKGEDVTGELAEARYAIGMLRGRGGPIVTCLIDGTSIVTIAKRGATPAQFPRRTGVPNRSPLLGPREQKRDENPVAT